MVQVLSSSSSSLFFFPGKNKIYCNNKGPHCAKKGPTGQYHLCSRPQLGKRCAEIATLAQSLVMSYATSATPLSLLFHSFLATDRIICPLQLEVNYFFIWKVWVCIVETNIVLNFNISIVYESVFSDRIN